MPSRKALQPDEKIVQLRGKMKELKYYIISAIIFLLIIGVVKEIQYRQINRYFPKMSRWEFFNLEDSIRITQSKNNEMD